MPVGRPFVTICFMTVGPAPLIDTNPLACFMHSHGTRPPGFGGAHDTGNGPFDPTDTTPLRTSFAAFSSWSPTKFCSPVTASSTLCRLNHFNISAVVVSFSASSSNLRHPLFPFLIFCVQSLSCRSSPQHPSALFPCHHRQIFANVPACGTTFVI